MIATLAINKNSLKKDWLYKWSLTYGRHGQCHSPLVVVVVVVVGIQEFIAWTEHEWCRFWDGGFRLSFTGFRLYTIIKWPHWWKATKIFILLKPRNNPFLTHYGNVGLTYSEHDWHDLRPNRRLKLGGAFQANNISSTEFQLFIGWNEPRTHQCSLEDDEWEMVRKTVFFSAGFKSSLTN
jgi:hypothetical protein